MLFFQMEHLLRRHDGEYRTVVTTGVPMIASSEDSTIAAYRNRISSARVRLVASAATGSPVTCASRCRG
jgi:hypothetical protein